MGSDCLLLFLLIIFAWERGVHIFYVVIQRTHIPRRMSKDDLLLVEALGSYVILLLLRRPEEKGWPGFLLAIREPQVSINQPAHEE